MPWAEAMIRARTSELPPLGEGEIEGEVMPYAEAVREALRISMQLDPKVFVIGEGCPDPSGMFGVSRDLHLEFGDDRCMESPLSEEGVMGICVGAAMNGLRPVYMHNRPDFLLLAFNQIVNHAAKVHFMDAGQTSVPLVVWSAIGRGWGSGAQHSQAIQGLLLTVPGIKIALPSTPHDAKGIMLSAIADPNPVFLFEHRWLMRRRGVVPPGFYTVPLGKGVHRRRGDDVSVVGTSHILDLALEACDRLAAEDGLRADVIDLRTVKPLDREIVLESVSRTGRILVLDTGWQSGGVCAEIGCLVAEEGFRYLKAPVHRIGLPECHTPAGWHLEQVYYPDADRIAREIRQLIRE